MLIELLEKLTSNIIEQYKNKEQVRLEPATMENINRILEEQLKFNYKPIEHRSFFLKLAPLLTDYMSIEKFILGDRDHKTHYMDTLKKLTTLVIHHHNKIPALYPIKENYKIDLMGWLESEPGTTDSKQIVTPFFTALHQSMDDTIHPYDRYKDIKMLAHKLGLDGKIEFPSKDGNIVEVELEGYDSFYTFSEIVQSLKIFLSINAENKKFNSEYKEIINEALEALTLALDSKNHYLDVDFLLSLQTRYQSGEPIALPSGLYRHSMNYILHNDLIAYINRGYLAEKEKYGSLFHTITEKDNVHIDFIREIIIGSNTIQEEQKIRKKFLEKVIKEDLALEHQIVHHHAGKAQKVGNCTWANVKQLFKSLLLIAYKKRHPELSWEELSDEMIIIYKLWSSWDRTYSLQEFTKKYVKEIVFPPETALLKRILLKQYNIRKDDEVERGAYIIKLLGKDEVVQFVKEIQSKLSSQPVEFNFAHFAKFVNHCSQAHSREIKGTHDISEDIEDALSLPNHILSFREPSIHALDTIPCRCEHHAQQAHERYKTPTPMGS